MKFEKFFKSVGTHGQVVKTVNNRWLICGGVGMKIPTGVNTFGAEVDPDDMFNAILSADIEDDLVSLVEAKIPADGKTTDIVRVFSTSFNDEVGISNAQYGLLEKHDRLVYLEIEDDYAIDHKYILITDMKGEEILGFIVGKNEI